MIRNTDTITGVHLKIRSPVQSRLNLIGTMNDASLQLSAAIQSNQQLQVALQNEKLAAAQKQRELETHLRDSQDCLMQKVREVAAAREVQTGLRSEIEALKIFIESEEEKYARQSIDQSIGRSSVSQSVSHIISQSVIQSVSYSVS